MPFVLLLASPVALLAFPFFFALLYSVGMLIYIPFKLWTVSPSPLGVWTCLTRGRLLVAALTLLIAAPVPSVALLR
jgi:hypothetical protein